MKHLHDAPARLVQLVIGLWLYGVTMAFMVRAGLGLDPWDVFHQGLAKHWPLSFGMTVNVVGAIILLAWIPLRQKPGIGTVLNVLLIGTAADITLRWLPTAHALPLQIGYLAFGVVGNGLAGALYIGAGLGPGPRDGLWTSVVRRRGWSVRVARTLIEGTVLLVGWLLGGSVGLGTVLYAIAIGPLVQRFLQLVPVTPQSPLLSRRAVDQAECCPEAVV
ncbi:putative membrane protein YczE [Branchiibius hedensis]|uniref:Uncharacterized membrane protein YczE n=1 Tax=Branchiibius hedensis TaxID=672460 RepID=A0A2Y8ZTJ7_9MICO|nr:hypothetical protein [Branchiibius hedensis]PWJ26909.1 putative membrane protein YczE [Branchiibius hedensis]SSA35720.1 Uncharacterized membrane protein YczE [Branchiibius hedensis]